MRLRECCRGGPVGLPCEGCPVYRVEVRRRVPLVPLVLRPQGERVREIAEDLGLKSQAVSCLINRQKSRKSGGVM